MSEERFKLPETPTAADHQEEISDAEIQHMAKELFDAAEKRYWELVRKGQAQELPDD